MPNNEQIFYACASLFLPALGCEVQGRERLSNAIGHFYIAASDGTLAGAIASDICRERNMKFIDYLCLPQPIRQESVGGLEEHRIGYLKALEDGRSVVVSAVLGGDLNPIDLTPLVI